MSPTGGWLDLVEGDAYTLKAFGALGFCLPGVGLAATNRLAAIHSLFGHLALQVNGNQNSGRRGFTHKSAFGAGVASLDAATSARCPLVGFALGWLVISMAFSV